MEQQYTFLTGIAGEVQVPPDGIISRTLLNSDYAKVVLFGFAAGQELSEHTASMPAILHFLQGEADLKLGVDVKRVNAGAWAHMAAGLTHSISAHTPTVMLLVLLKRGA